MTNRALKSHKKIQLKLAGKLLLILFATIFTFSLAYYFLGKSTPIGEHGIYLDGCVAGYLESLYFSIVTITTLGYGDFTPLGFSRAVAGIEAFTGLILAGYSIAQVLSVKQDASIEYILKSQIIQNYTDLLGGIRDAKEAILDAHKINTKNEIIDTTYFHLYHGNPLYPSVIALQKINGYTKHIEEIKIFDEITDYLNRAATNIEELSSVVRKYINYVDAVNKNWKTTQTKKALFEIIRCLENFQCYIKHTKFVHINYKSQVKYDVVINKLILDLRRVSA